MRNVLVLMATYNGSKYLDEQLNSLFAQKGVQVAVLVRDDGSADGTTNILDRWKKSNALDWYTGEHLNVKFGFFDLMQEAAKRDGYEYFAFCDQDDVWDEDKLSCAINRLEKAEEKEALYYCGQRLVDEHLNLIGVHALNRKRNLYARFLLNDAAGCTMVFNRKLLDTVVSYKPDYLLMHDAWVVKVCLAVGGRVFVDCEPHMSYRQHGNNVVGLQNTLGSKMRRVKLYVDEQKVERQMLELKKGYDAQLAREYREIIEDILAGRNHPFKRFKLLNAKKYHFANLGLQTTFILKVLLNKL